MTKQRTKWFVPTSGTRVLDPVSLEPVPAEGKEVIAGDRYFIRRADEGSGKLLAKKPGTKAAKEA